MTACSPSWLARSAVAASSSWLDLHDDYWGKQGRKSIDAVAIFGGLLGITVAGRDALHELGLLPHALDELVQRDQRRRGIAH